MHLTLAGGDQTSQTEHKQLYQYCVDGNIAQACDFLKRHILSAKHDIIALIDES
jgi:DNA-binding GntR family transcriptional regulator